MVVRNVKCDGEGCSFHPFHHLHGTRSNRKSMPSTTHFRPRAECVTLLSPCMHSIRAIFLYLKLLFVLRKPNPVKLTFRLRVWGLRWGLSYLLNIKMTSQKWLKPRFIRHILVLQICKHRSADPKLSYKVSWWGEYSGLIYNNRLINIMKTYYSSTKTTYTFPLERRPTYKLKVSFWFKWSDILNQCDFDRLKTAL